MTRTSGSLLRLPLALLIGGWTSALQAGSASPQDDPPPISIAWRGAPGTAYVHQVVEPALVIHLDPGFAERDLVQPFRRPLDLPLRIEVEGWPCPDGTRMPAAHGSTRTPSRPEDPELLLNGTPTRAFFEGQSVFGGERRSVYRVATSWSSKVEGLVELGRPTLHYTTMEGGHVDPFGSPIAGERVEHSVNGNAVSIDIVPLPAEGRPVGHGDAVGSFRLASRVDPIAVDLGDSVELILELRGPGNLTDFTPPRYDDLEGFHGRGWRQEFEPGLRRLVYDLAPREEGRHELPELPFDYFDPAGTDVEGPGYRTLFTEAVTLRVYPPRQAGSDADSTEEDPGIASSESEKAGAKGEDLRPLGSHWILIGAAGLLLVIAQGIRSRRSKGRGDTSGPMELVHAAMERARENSSAGGPPDAKALGDALALALGVPAVSPEVEPLTSSLMDRGVPRDRAAEFSRRFVDLDHGRFGGPAVETPEGGWDPWLAEFEGVLQRAATGAGTGPSGISREHGR